MTDRARNQDLFSLTALPLKLPPKHCFILVPFPLKAEVSWGHLADVRGYTGRRRLV